MGSGEVKQIAAINIPDGEVCSQCFNLNTGKMTKEGGRSFFWFVILCLVTCGLGLIYLAFKSPAKKYKKCKSCGAENSMIPLSSPAGKILWQQHHHSTRSGHHYQHDVIDEYV